jgi:hypothetical protein
MLIRKRKTKRNQPEKPKPAYDPNLGSGWAPGVSDGSWLWPDSARQRFEKGNDGVTRPVRQD